MIPKLNKHTVSHPVPESSESMSGPSGQFWIWISHDASVKAVAGLHHLEGNWGWDFQFPRWLIYNVVPQTTGPVIGLLGCPQDT